MVAPAPNPNQHKLTGALYLATAALLFALLTVFAKLANQAGAIPAVQVAWARFAVGTLLLGGYIIATRQRLRPAHPGLMFGRVFFNVFGLLLFFLGVQHTSITNANLLNMTSPFYIFLFAPLFGSGDDNPTAGVFFLALTLIGAYLVVLPNFSSVQLGDAYAALSGLLGGIAISFLRQARKYDAAYLILFYQMAFGCIVMPLFGYQEFVLPNVKAGFYLLTSAVLGVVAQALLTIGYRYIDARSGSLVSASQLVVGAALGALIFQEPLTLHILLGGSLILLSLLGVNGVFNKWIHLTRNVKPMP